MSSWTLAESLGRLRDQLNTLAPNRSKASDGTIGDARHQAEGSASDHNPRWIAGANLVTAFDATHDPAGGLDCQRLADSLVRARDSRVKYLIWDRRIIDSRPGNNPWQWMPYPGSDPHTGHVHLSVVADPRCRDASPWMLPGLTGGGAAPAPTPSGVVLRKGDRGPEVLRLQTILTTRYPAYAHWSPLTDFFGDLTDAAVREFQRRSGLVPDGIVGALTRKALGL